MTKERTYHLLDAFSGAGGMGLGLSTYFRVTGVDKYWQPNYPCRFLLAEAVSFIRKYGYKFDAIHASPPCQLHSNMANIYKNPNHPLYNTEYFDRHEDLVEETRQALISTGRPYVIENVSPRVLISPIVLCGKAFGLKVYRHRYFESNIPLVQPEHFEHKGTTIRTTVNAEGFISVTGTGGLRNLPAGHTTLSYIRMAMGIPWMERPELSQAIPPLYGEYIGKQLYDYLRCRDV